jgi:hypothetical protein
MWPAIRGNGVLLQESPASLSVWVIVASLSQIAVRGKRKSSRLPVALRL